MASYKMHIAISERVKKELNLGNGFILGSILPDIYKSVNKNRQLTHYQELIDNRNIINIDKFIEDFKNQKNDITMGYLAHLIEDKIWFEEFCGKILKNINLYNIYGIIDKYVVNKDKLDICNIKENIINEVDQLNYNLVDKNIVKDAINNQIIDYGFEGNINFFYKSIVDVYFERACKEVKEILIKKFNNFN